MKPMMWLLLSGMLAGGAALPANAAPLGSTQGLKIAGENSGTTHVGYGRRHHRHYRHRHYGHRYYYRPYYSYYEPYYYRPYHRRHYYDGPRFGIYFGGHRGWRRHW